MNSDILRRIEFETVIKEFLPLKFIAVPLIPGTIDVLTNVPVKLLPDWSTTVLLVILSKFQKAIGSKEELWVVPSSVLWLYVNISKRIRVIPVNNFFLNSIDF